MARRPGCGDCVVALFAVISLAPPSPLKGRAQFRLPTAGHAHIPVSACCRPRLCNAVPRLRASAVEPCRPAVRGQGLPGAATRGRRSRAPRPCRAARPRRTLRRPSCAPARPRRPWQTQAGHIFGRRPPCPEIRRQMPGPGRAKGLRGPASRECGRGGIPECLYGWCVCVRHGNGRAEREGSRRKRSALRRRRAAGRGSGWKRGRRRAGLRRAHGRARSAARACRTGRGGSGGGG